MAMKAVKNKRRLWFGIKSARAQVDQVKLMYFYGSTFSRHRVYDLDEAREILEHPEFDIHQKTVLYLHGYVEEPSHESIHVIVNAYLKRGDHNIIILDWSRLADGNYFIDAVPNLKDIGPRVADVVVEWFDEGLDPESLHIVGHSLGAHLAGLIGRQVYKKSRGGTKIARISALDPAFPSFYPAIGSTALSKKDADFVDVIHTDAWFYGAPVSTGTVDFWPNGGRTLQPGCPRRNYKMLSDNDLCSHRRSWWFWAESVVSRDRSSFLAIRSKSWDDFKRGRVDESSVTQMGINCSPRTRKGNYYLQTNGEQPFSKGTVGLHYEKYTILQYK